MECGSVLATEYMYISAATALVNYWGKPERAPSCPNNAGAVMYINTRWMLSIMGEREWSHGCLRTAYNIQC